MNNTEIIKLVQSKIISLSNTHNISLRKLSILSGRSGGYLNQVVNNNMMPSLRTISNICEMYDIPLHEFFDLSAQYPIEYYQVVGEVQKLSAARLQALYVLLHEENQS